MSLANQLLPFPLAKLLALHYSFLINLCYSAAVFLLASMVTMQRKIFAKIGSMTLLLMIVGVFCPMLMSLPAAHAATSHHHCSESDQAPTTGSSANQCSQHSVLAAHPAVSEMGDLDSAAHIVPVALVGTVIQDTTAHLIAHARLLDRHGLRFKPHTRPQQLRKKE